MNKDLGGKISLDIWEVTKCNQMYPYKKKAEGCLPQTERRRQCDHRDRDRSVVATSRGWLSATSSWKRKGANSSLEPPMWVLPASILILVNWNWFPTPELWQMAFLLLKGIKFGIVWYRNHRKLISREASDHVPSFLGGCFTCPNISD